MIDYNVLDLNTAGATPARVASAIAIDTSIKVLLSVDKWGQSPSTQEEWRMLIDGVNNNKTDEMEA